MDCNRLGISELSSLIGGRSIAKSSCNKFSCVAIDSRKAEPGCLFFALNGKITDGHNFVKNAFEKGACAAVVQASKVSCFNLLEIADKAGKDLILVEDTLAGLQDSARVYLEKFPNLVKAGITGSSGKTTTKEIAAKIISYEKNTVMNRGNLNSETGLPLSVFEVNGDHEVGIFELGMNRKGEISEIAGVLKPNIALITNIGTAHIEYFGSKNKILNEKKDIFKFLKNDDTALIPKDDDYAAQLAEGVNAKVVYYSQDVFSELENTVSLGLDGTEITWNGEKIHFPLPGKHSLSCAMAAVAIAKEIPVSNAAIKNGLESVEPLFGRLEILKGKTTVICDCYNANPESMIKSIEFCDSVEITGKGARKIYVIGDMLELGDSSYAEHKKIGEYLKKSDAAKIFLFGKEVAVCKESLEKAGKEYFYTDDFNKLVSEIKLFMRAGDVFLLKASRSLALERLTGILSGGKASDT